MAFYSLAFKPSVETDPKMLPRAMRARIMERIDALAADPLSPQSVKPTGAEQLYRIRVGDYRVIYQIMAESKQVLIHYVRHRREVYRAL